MSSSRGCAATWCCSPMRQRFDLERCARWSRTFADPAVGAVSELVITTSDSHGGGRARRSTGATKSSSARPKAAPIRPSAPRARSMRSATPLRADPRRHDLDDVLIPLRIVRKEYRVLFEPRARAYDSASASAQRVRAQGATIAGTFQLFSRSCGCSTRAATVSGWKRCRTRRCGWRCRRCTRPCSRRAPRSRPARSGFTRQPSPPRRCFIARRSSALHRAATRATFSSSLSRAPSAC